MTLLNLGAYPGGLGTLQRGRQTEAVSSLSGLVLMSAATYWTLDRAAEWHMHRISPKAPSCCTAGMWCRPAETSPMSGILWMPAVVPDTRRQGEEVDGEMIVSIKERIR